MVIAIVLFAAGALFGLHILTHVLQNKATPKVSVVVHGLLVAIGLVMVIAAEVIGGSGRLMTSMIFFIIAALGGFVMVYFDIMKKQVPPKALAILHPILAAIGLVLLIIYVIGK
ncbi:MAG: hypothetical protein ACM3S2_14790 [Ignavibacteriales bacterium]